MDDLPLPFDPEHAIPPFEFGPPQKRSRKSSDDEDFTEATTEAAAAEVEAESVAEGTDHTEEYSTPLDIEPCSIRRMEEHVAFLEYKLKEIIRTKRLEIAYAKGRIDRVRVLNRHRRKKCSVDGCESIAMRGGVCARHGATKIRKQCKEEGCTNMEQNGGVCQRHGAKVRRCNVEGCNSQAHKGGTCRKHGTDSAKCTFEGCKLFTASGGMCGRHSRVSCGTGSQRKECSVEGCTANSVKGGLCRQHGTPPILCNHEGCTNKARKGGVCTMHGVSFKLCSHEGCTTIVRKGELSSKHGKKTSKHKRCKYEGCEKWAQPRKNGFCARHFSKQWFTSEDDTCPKVATAEVEQDEVMEPKSDLDANVKAKTELTANVWI